MPKSAARSAPEAISERKRNSGAMAHTALPMTEVLVVADAWQTEPDAEAVIQRAIPAAAAMARWITASASGSVCQASATTRTSVMGRAVCAIAPEFLLRSEIASGARLAADFR